MQFLDLAFQGLDALTLGGGQAITLAAVDLVALDPFQQSLGYAADLGRNGFNGSPWRWVFAPVAAITCAETP